MMGERMIVLEPDQMKYFIRSGKLKVVVHEKAKERLSPTFANFFQLCSHASRAC